MLTTFFFTAIAAITGVGPCERGMRKWEGKGRGVMGTEVKII